MYFKKHRELHVARKGMFFFIIIIFNEDKIKERCGFSDHITQACPHKLFINVSTIFLHIMHKCLLLDMLTQVLSE